MNDQNKDDKVYTASTVHGEDKKYLQYFGWVAWKVAITWNM
jgi:hypothetical protein